MPRLIEVQELEKCSSPLLIRVGDVLLIHATGGVVSGTGPAVELWGPFRSAVVALNGEILAPMGPPNMVLDRARATGSATLELYTGDPFHGPRTKTLLSVTVES